jgi:acyl-homoserine-lactone acylase
LDRPSANARALYRGYVAGVNRYVRDTGIGNLPSACKGAAWVRPYTEIDMWRITLAGQTPVQLAGVAAATPPGGAKPIRAGAFDAPTNIPQGQGSNAYALGREVTKTGHGVLLANPHYPWDGLNRFTRLHLIIPGKLNIVGGRTGELPTGCHRPQSMDRLDPHGLYRPPLRYVRADARSERSHGLPL